VDADEIRTRLADRLREAIALRGISLLELTSKAKVARPHLYKVLAGETAASVDYIAKLATVLDVDPAALLGTAPITRRTRRIKPSGDVKPSGEGDVKQRRARPASKP
jgi:transcriptional regulator with XRE-family HTH domain